MQTCKKASCIILCIACLFLGSRTANAFVENFDNLHDAYAINSYLQPDNSNLTIYFKKLFPMDGSPVNYILTAYNSSWQNPFTAGATLNINIDGTVFTCTAQAYSRQIDTYWHRYTARTVEFPLAPPLIAALADAHQVTIYGAGLPTCPLSPSELQDWQAVIGRSHY